MPHPRTLDLDLARTMLAVIPEVMGRAAHAVREQHAISYDRFKALVMLERSGGELRSGELAERSHVTPAAVTRLVDELVKDGLMRRESDPRDRRAHVLTLTAEGRREVRRFEGLAAAAVAEMLSSLGPAERSRVRGAFRDLERAVGCEKRDVSARSS